ncbi:MAG: hypothetical protein Q8N15_04085, partial [Bacillota bacterium]|nr:hypothetical protein [Bacillota bacterium]
MKFRQFNRFLRASAALPVTRDEAFVQRITGPTERRPSLAVRTSFSRLAASFAASAVAFAAFVFGFYGLHPAVVLTVDANPSIQLSVNHFDRVIRLKALNDDADDIVDQVTWFNRTPETVLSSLYDELVAAGYVDPGDVLLLGLSGVSAAKAETYETAFAAALSAVTLLYMNDYRDSEATVILRASQAFQESVEASDDDRSAIWDDAYSEAAAGAYDFVVTTTAAMMTTTAGETTSSQPGNDITTTILELLLSDRDLTLLAASLDVSVAKLRLAIAVFNGTPAYQTTDDLETLAHMPISELAIL